jgi:hypothetical protein
VLKPWSSGRQVAFVPVSNSQVDGALPDDFALQVAERAFFDPDASGVDRSLQAYVRAVSSGWAHIDGQVLPAVVSNGTDVTRAAIDSLPANHSYVCVVAVLPHSTGPHRGGFAWWEAAERNGITDFARVALFTDPLFSTRQGIGVWAMEVLHAVTHFGDLYNVTPHPGRFDVMACNCGTHPSTHTKAAMGWLHSGAVRSHPVGSSASYTLHAASFPQPPPPGRLTAVSVPSQKSADHYLIEARLRTDIYETPGFVSQGIPSEGVVVYEVGGTLEVYLRASGLGVGESAQIADEGLSVRVTGSVDGGFRVSVASRASARCAELSKQIEALRDAIEGETDVNLRKQLLAALGRALREFRALNCARTSDAPNILTDLLTPADHPLSPTEGDARAAPSEDDVHF